MTIEAMRLALDALELEADGWDSVSPITRDAITALLAAINEAEKQEPVGWVECDGVVVWYNRDAAIGRDLYTAPRQWQGLTDEEIAEMHNKIKVRLMGTYKTEDIYRAIEAKLKEKNT